MRTALFFVVCALPVFIMLNTIATRNIWMKTAQDDIYLPPHICHGRKSNLVEFQIKINLVETPIQLSTGRNSNHGDLGIALGSEI